MTFRLFRLPEMAKRESFRCFSARGRRLYRGVARRYALGDCRCRESANAFTAFYRRAAAFIICTAYAE